ncbi:MAG: response regulator [Deltaproteobacteria bacterium]|nr:response regulator [Deltaproteobacteria bacterium]
MRTIETGTVLVVDDVPANLDITVRSLEREGIRCRTATGGLECLDVVGQEPIDLILLDLGMPVMDGWATLAALRERPAGRNIPVVLFTCHDNLSNRERAMCEGLVDFLPRPVSRARLVQTVRTHLGARARVKALDALDRRLQQEAVV